jgi:ArsR family transcriptional regulator, arsenate/arsenite/antimonite-responsive transcriptional repressor
MRLVSAAAKLEALGNPTRLQIYRTLVKTGPGGLPVGRLQSRLGAAPSTLSHHLQKLIHVDLVTQERQATTLICRANFPVMEALLAFLTEECCTEDQGCQAGSE